VSSIEAADAVVVVPTYDEVGNVPVLLARVRDVAPGMHVLVVDDASPDGTADAVRQAPGFGRTVWLLERDAKSGLGGAYRAGFAWALARGYAAVGQMDADLSHPPERLPALLAALADADVVVGSRYVAGGGVAAWPRSRRLISSAGNTYVRLELRLPVHDTTAVFKMFRRSALVEIGVLASASNGYSFQIENTWRAVRARLRVVEVPITFTDRSVGSSKMSQRIVTEALWRVLTWRVRELLPPLRTAARARQA
jgi:dolichol-phosphate mannosyltransferase